MCGRITVLYTWREIWRLSAPFWQNLDEPMPLFNVGPKAEIPIIRGGRAPNSDWRPEIGMARWWLIPRWSRTPDSPFATFNARSEDAHETKSFKASFRDRRCVVPASGFYEWRVNPDQTKTPHYITRADNDPLFFAGLWDAWGDPSMDLIESCTVLTTTPNAEMRPLHDRMPCVLEPEEIETWIGDGLAVDDARAMLRPAGDGTLVTHPVSKKVGSVRNDGPGLIRPVPDSHGTGLFG